MTVTVPRAEINALMERYDDFWGGHDDRIPAEVVRKYAASLRADRDIRPGDTIAQNAYVEDCVEADDLDALADRYEQDGQA